MLVLNQPNTRGSHLGAGEKKQLLPGPPAAVAAWLAQVVQRGKTRRDAEDTADTAPRSPEVVTSPEIWDEI